MISRSHTLLAAIALLAATAPTCFGGLITININAGGLRDATGTLISNTPTLWAIIYDDDGDGQLPGDLSSDDSLASGDAASAWSAFAGKTIVYDTMIGSDRIIAAGEVDTPDGVTAIPLEYDLATEGLTSGRAYGIYWFPGRTLATNQLPSNSIFPVGGINEITNFLGTRGTTIPNDGASDNTILLASDLGGPLPTTRFHAISAEAPDFANWIAGFPAVGSENGFNDDPDGDGLENGVESALGSRPDTANTGVKVISTASGLMTAQSSKAKPTLADVTATWQWSDNLINWHSSGMSNGSATVTINETVTDPGDPIFDITEVEAMVTVGQLDRLFLRLNVTQTP